MNWNLLFFLSIIWSLGIVVSLKKTECPRRDTIFDYQNWSIWVGVFFITVFELLGALAVWSLWSFQKHQAILWIVYMMSEGCILVWILSYYRLVIRQPYITLGLTFDRSCINLIFGLRWILTYFLIGYGLLYIFLLVKTPEVSEEWLSRLLHEENPVKDFVFSVMGNFEVTWGGRSLFIPVIYFVVFGPLFEEILFRGLLYGPVRKKVGPLMAILIISALFTIAHHSYKAPYFVMGLLFTYLYERTQSLAPSIFSHMVLDLNMMIEYFRRNTPVSATDLKTEISWIFILFAVALLTVEVTYHQMIKKGYSLKPPVSG